MSSSNNNLTITRTACSLKAASSLNLEKFEMSNDHEAQNDEMLALESIFDADEFSFRKDNEEVSGHFNAFVTLPDEIIKIEYQLAFSKKKNQPNQILVKFLPPIELSFTLPSDYPSTSPPRFTLICPWLNRFQLSKLCVKLDSLWNENKGLEILYLWLSFLKEESFCFLELGTTIDLSKQYTFNIKKIEKRKILQNKCEDKNVTPPDAAETSSASTSTVRSVQSVCVNPAGAQDTGLRPVCSGNRGRGRGKSKLNTSNPVGQSSKSKAEQETPMAQVKELSGKRENQWGSRNLKNPSKEHDPRVVSCETLQIPLISFIVEFNKSRAQKEFQRNIYPCMICFEDKPGSQCVEFCGCGHIFCRECVGTYFEVTIRDGNVHGLTCPEEGCKSEALQSQIADLVSPELFSRYDELLLSSALDGMEDIVYCPRKTCQYPVTYDRAETMARCAHCSYTFCTLCRMGYHGVDPCRLRMDSGLLAEYESATDERKQFLEKKYGRKTIQTLLETGYSVQWMKENSKSCPHCNAAIEKSDGCNKMTCWKCNTFFCWLCNTRLNPSNPYSHFNSPASACFQMLFHGIPETDPEDDFVFEDDEDEQDFFAP